jgi:energy-coupling factor transporter ATP-binding protein EcfA2
MLDKENVLFSDLRKMVDVDTYFRVHREITLNIGNRIIFVLVTFISGGLYIYNLYFPLLSFEGGIISLVYATVILLQIRLLHLSLNVGLYSFPLKLGAILCIPDKNINSQNRQILDKNIDTISFVSKKVKLDGKNYLHNISFDFKKGEKYLISGPIGSGKSMILSIISGHTKLFYGLPWTIRLNNRRFLYKKWHEGHPKTFFISPYFQSEAPIYDFIKNYEVIEEYQDIPAFSFLFSNGKFLGQSITKGKNSLIDICVLQILYCIIESPQIVTVDNIWIDLNHPHINEAMSVMFSKLKNSIIVCGSSSENNLHLYDSVFKI